ncbi:PH domain-containing protein [Flavobacterium sp.]|uniref:PH domain-containing protein n=1 Tax=Flavobacterium sp. TaxID=239 RepID=UPI002606AFD0|nr:PH domain-containing protein [Flavobacterium sp.]
MKEQIKKFLNEEQDPKAIEKVTAKLNDILMKNEEVGYIAVQKKPALTVLPDSIVLTNKRIIICQPKNLGLSMHFIDYTWDEVDGAFVKENILGSEFTFSTKTELQVTIDYIPKIQARKIYTYAKEQLDSMKNGAAAPTAETVITPEAEIIEEVETEEVTNFAEIIPATITHEASFVSESEPAVSTASLNQEELFAKLQNYKKLLDNGLILQGEYDAFKKEILSQM